MLRQGILGSETILGVVFALGAAFAVSFMALTIRMGTNDGKVTDTLFVVILTNIVVFVPLAGVLYYPHYHLTLNAVVAFAAAGLAGTLLGRAFTYTSVERIGASRTEPIKSSQPLHATLIAVIVLQEFVSTVHMIGIVLIVVGVATISWETTRGSGRDVQNVKPIELVFPLLGAFFYGIEPIFAKIGFAEGTPVLVGLSIKTLVAFIAVGAYLGWRNTLPRDLSFRNASLRWYIAAGVLNTTFLFLYYLALETAPVSVVIPIVTTSPLIVAVLSYLFLPDLERVTSKLVASASIVVVGAAIIALYS